MKRWTPLLIGIAVITLTACKEDAPPEPLKEGDHTQSPALIINGKTVDPLCFINMGSAEGEQPFYPTENCGGEHYEANLKDPPPLPDSFVSIGYYYLDPDAPGEKYPGLIGYRYLGDYHGLKAIETVENGGGSGVFTAVQLLRPGNDGTLKIEQTLAGGDRCNGGISEAFMDGHTLVYSVNLTPFDFLSVANYNPKNIQPYDDLDACAICCYGHLQFVDKRPHAVVLEEGALTHIQANPEDQQTMQSCFDEIFVESFKERKTALSLRELRDFVRQFHKTCLAQ